MMYQVIDDSTVKNIELYAFIPVNDGNPYYVQFKQDIANGETLLNVDGSTMTHDEAMSWVDAH